MPVHAITILQPDLYETRGLGEGLPIAALASAWKRPIDRQAPATVLNMSTTLHFLASIDNGEYFDVDVATILSPRQADFSRLRARQGPLRAAP